MPGLFGLATVPREIMVSGLNLQALSLFLSRSDRCAPPCKDTRPAGMLCQCFGLDAGGEQEWPVAPLTYLADGGGHGAGVVMRADPVHLRVDLKTLVLADADSLSLGREEAEALAAEINGVYRDEDWELDPLHPRRWYLRLSSKPEMATVSPLEVAGEGLQPLFPRGREAALWSRRLNEIQMLLHASPVNQQREARGDLPVNSLWLWGAGTLPEPASPPWTKVWTDDPLGHGLAQLTGTKLATRPVNADTWLVQARGDQGKHLIVLDDGYILCRRLDVEGWRTHLTALEEQWLGPLEGMVRQRQVGSVTLVPGGMQAYRLTPGNIKKWWRRHRPLSTFMAGT